MTKIEDIVRRMKKTELDDVANMPRHKLNLLFLSIVFWNKAQIQSTKPLWQLRLCGFFRFRNILLLRNKLMTFFYPPFFKLSFVFVPSFSRRGGLRRMSEDGVAIV